MRTVLLLALAATLANADDAFVHPNGFAVTNWQARKFGVRLRPGKQAEQWAQLLEESGARYVVLNAADRAAIPTFRAHKLAIAVSLNAAEAQAILPELPKLGPIGAFYFDFKQLAQPEALLRDIRGAQPEALFHNATIGSFGDLQAPPFGIPSDPADPRLVLPWEITEPLGSHAGEWIIDTLIDCAVKGGSLILQVDQYNDSTVKRLHQAGEFLKVNGEAIYNTTALSGSKPKYKWTRGLDGDFLYLLANEPMPNPIEFQDAQPSINTQVRMLGFDQPIRWRFLNRTTYLTLPAGLPPAGLHAWAIRVAVK